MLFFSLAAQLTRSHTRKKIDMNFYMKKTTQNQNIVCLWWRSTLATGPSCMIWPIPNRSYVKSMLLKRISIFFIRLHRFSLGLADVVVWYFIMMITMSLITRASRTFLICERHERPNERANDSKRSTPKYKNRDRFASTRHQHRWEYWTIWIPLIPSCHLCDRQSFTANWPWNLLYYYFFASLLILTHLRTADCLLALLISFWKMAA